MIFENHKKLPKELRTTKKRARGKKHADENIVNHEKAIYEY